jgi:hypothetical protein
MFACNFTDEDYVKSFIARRTYENVVNAVRISFWGHVPACMRGSLYGSAVFYCGYGTCGCNEEHRRMREN